jgi:hypothetical protein
MVLRTFSLGLDNASVYVRLLKKEVLIPICIILLGPINALVWQAVKLWFGWF